MQSHHLCTKAQPHRPKYCRLTPKKISSTHTRSSSTQGSLAQNPSCARPFGRTRSRSILELTSHLQGAITETDEWCMKSESTDPRASCGLSICLDLVALRELGWGVKVFAGRHIPKRFLDTLSMIAWDKPWLAYIY